MPRKKGPPSSLDLLDELLRRETVTQPTVPEEFIAIQAKVAEPVVQNSSIEKLTELIVELAKRRAESLVLYEPLPNQILFHQSSAPERVLRGSVRGGKTLPAAVECARAVTGRDPYGKWPKHDGVFYIVGKSEAHLADPIYKKLFRAGAFKIIRDLVSGMWRAFRPWDEDDVARSKEARLAPPLIPPRMVQETSWVSKKDSIPRMVKLRSGWEIRFYSAGGAPPQGTAIDGAWFDEEIDAEQWYAEIASRLLDNEGKFFWSAAPQAGSQELYELHTRSVDEERAGVAKEKRSVEEFFISLADNPHIKQAQKDALSAKLSEEERRIRIGGEFAILSYLVYPQFSKDRHGIHSFDIPPEWTRYLIVDPGTQICAVTFFAVPPPDHPLVGRKIMYEELYLRQCTAQILGESVQPKVFGRNFEAFLIDHQMSRQTEMGSGKSIEDQYREVFKALGIKSRQTGSAFLWASSDKKGGISAFRSWLEIKTDGQPTFLYFKDRISWLVYEFERYHNAKKNGIISDTPIDKHDHLMSCCRYAAMHGLPHVELPPGESRVTGVMSFIQRWMANNKKKGRGGVSLGPGSTPG